MTTTPRHGERAGRSPSLSRFVVLVLCLGLVAGSLWAGSGPDVAGVGAPTTITLLALLWASVLVPLRAQHRGGSTGFTLDEGVVVALLFAAPLRWLPLLVAGVVALAHVSRRADRLKVAYNLGHRALGTTAAAGTFWLVHPGSQVTTGRGLIAAVAAVVTYNVVNLAVTVGLRRILTGTTPRATIQQLKTLYAVTAGANAAYGIVLASVALLDLVATVFAGGLMIGLYLGFRGYATSLEDRRRAGRLQDLTRTLIDLTASDTSMQRYLRDLRGAVGAEGAALLLIEGDGVSRTIRDGTAVSDRTSCPFIADALAWGGAVLRVGTADREHRDAIAAPVVYEGRTVGVIAVYDRVGLEPWDETDATLLGTIANEAAVALKNVELFTAVERERALLAEESRKLSDIVDNASDGIVMIEADGRIAAWNGAMEQITGLSGQDTIGQPWCTVLRLRDPDGADLAPDGPNAIAMALRGERTVGDTELQVRRPDGRWRWLRGSASPIERSGRGVVGAVLVVRDVTREHEVDELKSDFIATVSHELRTPLTPLRGFLDTLVAKGDRLDEDQVNSIYRSMRGQVTRLERLVRDLLLVADVDRHQLRLRVDAVDLVSAVDAAVARIAPSPEPGRVRVEGPARVGAIGDEAAVVRILSSLIDNAVRHTEGRITVRLAGDHVRAFVEVADEGPGIPVWEQELVFQRFHRLGNHLHRIQGPGLGLPIARSLAQAQHGDLTLRSDVGRGSTFRLDLPAAALEVLSSNDRTLEQPVHGGRLG